MVALAAGLDQVCASRLATLARRRLDDLRHRIGEALATVLRDQNQMLVQGVYAMVAMLHA
jgi:hypothetical protein